MSQTFLSNGFLLPHHVAEYSAKLNKLPSRRKSLISMKKSTENSKELDAWIKKKMAPMLRDPNDKTQIPGYNYFFHTHNSPYDYGPDFDFSSNVSTAPPLPPQQQQQTHGFPYMSSIVVPLCITFICNIFITIITSKSRNASDAAQDLHQNAETHTQMTTNADKSSLIKCVAALEELEDISDDAYRKAVKKFMNPDWREMFIAMSNERKREWVLQHIKEF